MVQFAGLRNLPDQIGPLAAEYAAYWLSLPKHAGIPFKSALDLGAMRKFAAHFVIVERHAPHRFTWRLVGSGVREFSGVELTGSDAFDFHRPSQREKALAAYNAQLDTPCGAWGVTILRSAAGYEVATEVLVLPLRDGNGAPRFLANTVEAYRGRDRFEPQLAADMVLLSWLQHRFIDIGFGEPKFPRRQV